MGKGYPDKNQHLVVSIKGRKVQLIKIVSIYLTSEIATYIC